MKNLLNLVLLLSLTIYTVSASYSSCNEELSNENEILARKIANLQLQLENSLKELRNIKFVFNTKDNEIENLKGEIKKITEEFTRKIKILMLEIERLTEENARLRHMAKDVVVTDERDQVKTALDDDGHPLDTTVVTEFEITHQIMNYIPLKFSQTFRNLQQLTIRASELKVLRPNDLSGLVHLELLKLTENQLKKIEMGSLRGLVSLEVLDLSQNRIEVIDTGVFDSLTNLRSLDLHQNQLSNLQFGLFAKLKNLIDLDLSYNPLKSIKSDVFPCPSHIQELKIVGCGLSSIEPSILACMSHLNSIDLRQNQCINMRFEDIGRNPSKMHQIYNKVGMNCH